MPIIRSLVESIPSSGVLVAGPGTAAPVGVIPGGNPPGAPGCCPLPPLEVSTGDVQPCTQGTGTIARRLGKGWVSMARGQRPHLGRAAVAAYE